MRPLLLLLLLITIAPWLALGALALLGELVALLRGRAPWGSGQVHHRNATPAHLGRKIALVPI